MMYRAISAFTSCATRYLFFTFTLLFSMVSLGEENSEPFQLALLAEILAEGSLDADEEVLFGLEVRYFLARVEPHHFFSTFGYLSDYDKVGSAVDMFRLDVGGQYDLFTYWNNRSYFEYSLGMAYVQETFSAALIDRDTTDTFDEIDYKASLGFGFEYLQHLSSKLYVTQYGDLGRTLGVSFTYSF